LISSSSIAQNSGSISGSIESNTHFYTRDSRTGFSQPENPLASNNYLHLQYSSGPFSGALQFEAYMPPLSGYPYQLEGNRLTLKEAEDSIHQSIFWTFTERTTRLR
jgi:hypothetical protein